MTSRSRAQSKVVAMPSGQTRRIRRRQIVPASPDNNVVTSFAVRCDNFCHLLRLDSTRIASR